MVDMLPRLKIRHASKLTTSPTAFCLPTLTSSRLTPPGQVPQRSLPLHLRRAHLEHLLAPHIPRQLRLAQRQGSLRVRLSRNTVQECVTSVAPRFRIRRDVQHIEADLQGQQARMHLIVAQANGDVAEHHGGVLLCSTFRLLAAACNSHLARLRRLGQTPRHPAHRRLTHRSLRPSASLAAGIRGAAEVQEGVLHESHGGSKGMG
mmetsp:Transcript_6151/g.13270  ORF Transcript_6151/g.13270 Transcript_6151/m.13270 type:complete len:205 (-) Transcript_6151:42-656(-)